MSNAAEMDAQEIINYIATAPKKTPVKLYVREKPGMKVQWGDAHVYGGRRGKTVFGDWDELKAILDANAESIDYYDVENDCRNSAVPMLDLKGINARIEPGAIIRDRVEIGDRAVIMMGAIINIGSVIGEGSMIDMGAVLGGRATVGRNCHIGAGTVLAGVVEPASACLAGLRRRQRRHSFRHFSFLRYRLFPKYEPPRASPSSRHCRPSNPSRRSSPQTAERPRRSPAPGSMPPRPQPWVE